MYAIEDSVCPDGGSVLRECETGEGFHSWHPLRGGMQQFHQALVCMHTGGCHAYANEGLPNATAGYKEHPAVISDKRFFDCGKDGIHT